MATHAAGPRAPRRGRWSASRRRPGRARGARARRPRLVRAWPPVEGCVTEAMARNASNRRSQRSRRGRGEKWGVFVGGKQHSYDVGYFVIHYEKASLTAGADSRENSPRESVPLL